MAQNVNNEGKFPSAKITNDLKPSIQKEINDAPLINLNYTYPTGKRVGLKILVVFESSCVECTSTDDLRKAIMHKVIDAASYALILADSGKSNTSTAKKISLTEMLKKIGGLKGSCDLILQLVVACFDCCPRIISGRVIFQDDSLTDENEINNLNSAVLANVNWNEINDFIQC